MIEEGIQLDIAQLKRAGVDVCAIVKLSTQPPGVLQQVTLSPRKLSRAGYLRLGETKGDEARCWIHPDHVYVVEILGQVTGDQVTPFHAEQERQAG